MILNPVWPGAKIGRKDPGGVFEDPYGVFGGIVELIQKRQKGGVTPDFPSKTAVFILPKRNALN